jgi:hypothetical protein
MDNGLIFPYPRVGVPRRGRCVLTTRTCPLPAFGWGGVGERGNPGGSSRVMG